MNEYIKLNNLLKLLASTDIYVHIRRAFGDADTYYDGLVRDLPEEFEYLNRTVEAIYPFNYTKGDVNWVFCEALDIAVSDLDIE